MVRTAKSFVAGIATCAGPKRRFSKRRGNSVKFGADLAFGIFIDSASNCGGSLSTEVLGEIHALPDEKTPHRGGVRERLI